MLQPRAHGSAYKVLSTLVHGSYDFVPLNSNPNGVLCEKGGLIYKLEFDLQPIWG